jgi:hypothetical protein
MSNQRLPTYGGGGGNREDVADQGKSATHRRRDLGSMRSVAPKAPSQIATDMEEGSLLREVADSLDSATGAPGQDGRSAASRSKLKARSERRKSESPTPKVSLRRAGSGCSGGIVTATPSCDLPSQDNTAASSAPNAAVNAHASTGRRGKHRDIIGYYPVSPIL